MATPIYRTQPVRPEDWQLQGIKWDGKYYIDTRMSFGCRSSVEPVAAHIQRSLARPHKVGCAQSDLHRRLHLHRRLKGRM